MTQYRVRIPEELYALVECQREGLPAVMVINQALLNFPWPDVFGHHLSIIIDLVNIADNGMPSPPEQKIAFAFSDSLDTVLKGAPDHPNALFLARITWNRTLQLIYRIHDPESAHAALQIIIDRKTHQREFDYRIDPDVRWEMSRWYLDAVSPKPH